MSERFQICSVANTGVSAKFGVPLPNMLRPIVAASVALLPFLCTSPSFAHSTILAYGIVS